MPEKPKTFLMATEDLQNSPTYERLLEIPGQDNPTAEVVADRDLFENNRKCRET